MTDKKIDDISKKIKDLYKTISSLKEDFPHRHFTLDGHLVGSIGEVLAEYYYDLELFKASNKGHDAKTKDNKNVEVKITQREKIGIRHEPEHLLVLKIEEKDGEITFKEIYNGPGNIVWSKANNKSSNGQRSISLNILRDLMNGVESSLKIPKKVEFD